MYQALYRKYRPSNFNEIAGQGVIVKTLKNAIKNNRLSHAYLFSGPRGTGKTSIAKIVAKTINCENLDDFIPCNECKSCLEFNNKNDVDIIEIDAASNNGVDEIREIRNKVDLVPSFSKYKVYIIDEVHMLTQGAFNALLKTLEEPPGHVIFILATTEPHKIPNTILSRCQRFDFKRISNEDIVNRLRVIASTEGVNVSDDVLFEIARLSDGGLRDSISLLDQTIAFAPDSISVSDVHEVNGTIMQDDIKKIVDGIINLDYDLVFNLVCDYIANGKNCVKIAQDIILFFENILLCFEAPAFLRRKGYNYDLYSNYSLSTDNIVRCIDVLNDCLVGMKKSSNLQLSFETSLINVISVFGKENFSNNVVDASVKNKANVKNNNNVSIKHKKVFDDNLFKKIRVDNTLSKFNKIHTKKIISGISCIGEYLLDSQYGKLASMISDGIVKAASDEYIIFVYENADMSNLFNSNFICIEELINKCLNKKYRVVSVSVEEWDIIKDDFNNKRRDFVYKSEGNGFYDNSSVSSDDEIADMFNDVVEYK